MIAPLLVYAASLSEMFLVHDSPVSCLRGIDVAGKFCFHAYMLDHLWAFTELLALVCLINDNS